MAKKDILAELKSAIGQQKLTPGPASPVNTTPEPEYPAARKPVAPERRPAKSASLEPVPRSGRGSQFYLDDADRKIIHRLAVWFGSQDRRVSDSQVIKTAIRMADAQQGAKLLELCDQVRAADRRLQKKAPSRKAG